MNDHASANLAPPSSSAVVILCLLMATQAAGATGDRIGTQFQINTQTIDAQGFPAVGPDGAGGFVVAWSSFGGQDGEDAGIFGQRFTSAGAAAGAEFQINTHTAGVQRIPRMAPDGAGGFVTVWQSDGQDGSSSGVFGQRFTGAGAAAGSEFQVNTYTAGSQGYPGPRNGADVGPDGAGGFVVVWPSDGQDGDDWGIFGQRFASAGAAIGSEFQVNTYTTERQRFPKVAADGAGGFVIVWSSFGQDGVTNGVFGQRFTSAGAAAGTEFQINTFTPTSQYGPVVALDGAGGFVVSWNSFGQDGLSGSGWGVFGQRFTSAGAAAGIEFQINTATVDHQLAMSIGPDGTGGFVVGWDDGHTNTVVGQRFTSAGAAAATEFQVNTNTVNFAFHTAISPDGAGGFVVVWEGSAQDGSGYGVFGQRFQGICPVSPSSGCTAPQKALVKLLDNGDASKRKLLWKWLKGTAVNSDFGDPTASTSYTLCLYSNVTKVFEATVRPGGTCDGADCWKETSKGFSYKNKSSNEDGLFRVLLKEGTDKAKIIVKGKGVGIDVSALPIAGGATVTVQLFKDAASGMECWGSVFNPPAVKSTATQYKDKQ